ncbi:gas vesicle protein [Nocardiopsis alkaliphila]|uniref:gas vesicle protein n=1 Tax=Nocardiopsis alkaliphila TaxID=225762 RepID=UPI0003473498|nr:gas vesicle protein [Nocardiopsis alkaliphila]
MTTRDPAVPSERERGVTGFFENTSSLARSFDQDHPLADRDISLVDLLDRVLGKGVIVTGDLTISIADVDLVRVSLRALISSINEDVPSPWEHGHPVRGVVRAPRTEAHQDERSRKGDRS